MTNQGKCPKCDKTVLHVRVETINGLIDDESKARCMSFSCIHCNAVLGVQLDSRAKRRPGRKLEAQDKATAG
ncbi:MAG TPA: hypothetical protein VNI56_03980 [Xanthomonadaceae bacterium]|nr:hypothetical protein [Xanthomonadaceae bacterium]